MMIQDFLTLSGYGQFVWPAFIFTFSSFYILYLKSFKEFKKQEKSFSNECQKIKSIKINTGKRKETTEEIFSNNPVY